MKPKYMLNLIHEHLQSVSGQVADDLTFLPDVYDAGSTLQYDELTKRIVERKLAEATKLLREAEMLLKPCVVTRVATPPQITFTFAKVHANVL